MKYKAFQDWYREAKIRHLLLFEYNGNLISPPFATELCKDYNKILVWNKNSYSYIDLDLPPVTSKTNAAAIVNEKVWFIPYGIWDNFNTVVELNHTEVNYHSLAFRGKGQFYSIASNGQTAFSFPLGYEDTNYCIYITDKVISHKLPYQGIKLHMGTVFCNNRYWSMPRGDEPGYNKLISFDGEKFKSFSVDVNNEITRKYSDIIVKDNTLYSLPFGETAGLTELVEFNTDTEELKYHKLDIPDFSKKFNAGVLIDEVIIGVPYGDENSNNSNWGIIFNTKSKTSKSFDIGIAHGGKYRYRCGIAYKNHAYFFPSGTPSCPILKIDKNGNITKKYFIDQMLGRPIIYQDKIFIMSYDLKNHTQRILSFSDLEATIEFEF